MAAHFHLLPYLHLPSSPPCIPSPRSPPNGTFWGFVSALVDPSSYLNESLPRGWDAQLKRLSDLGFDYVLLAPQDRGNDIVLGASSPDAQPLLTDPVTAVISVLKGNRTDLYWRLEVAQKGGWVPEWRGSMLAVCAVASVLMGLLCFGILVNRRKLVWLVAKLKVG